MAQQRLDHLVEVLLIHQVDLRCNHEAHASALRRLDGDVRPFLRGDTPQEDEVVLVAGPHRIVIERKSVVDGRRPVRVWHRPALRLAYRDERSILIAAVDSRKPTHIEAPMECRHQGRRRTAKSLEREVADM